REDIGYGYFQIWVAGELARAGRVADAEKIIDTYIASLKAKPQEGRAALQELSVLLTTGQDRELDPHLIAKCRTLFKSALESAKATTSSGGGYGSVYGNVITQLTKQDRWDDALECVGEVLEWQAQQTAELRPSQRERLDANTAPLN